MQAGEGRRRPWGREKEGKGAATRAATRRRVSCSALLCCERTHALHRRSRLRVPRVCECVCVSALLTTNGVK